MKAENWTTIKQVLQQALNLAPFEREDFLSKSVLSAEIKEEVISLLEFEKQSENFMSATAGGLTGELISEENGAVNSLVNQKIGIYEIVGEIGFGGMGAVYLAERRDEKFEQKVAIKMLKREFNTEKIRGNFRREREIQAKLNHPNIARLLDAGTTEDCVPYLVMEYIEGVPIDKFCEREKLSLNARLKLFNRVCEAVAFAHRNLIVHRDLKPSNILVNKAGEPKLLDFGISKLLYAGDEANEKQPITIVGAMTPEYASPEQIRGETVTTATDVYSLGVVLFKILTGNYPYNFKNKTNGNILKEVTESEPIRPSAVVNSARDNANPKSEIPNSKSLAGDLDNIILKSLSKEPERRYQTVEQFSADVWRFVDGLPVMARRTTFFYQASKFYGRNKKIVFAAAFVLISLFAGLTVALWQTEVARGQARIAADARREAESETEHAQTEKEKAEKISRFMSKVISYANPSWYAEGAKFGGGARVIDAIEDLSDKIDREFAGEADVAAELHHKFSEVFLMAGKGESGERLEKFSRRRAFHAVRALELRRQFYGERHELVAKDLFYAYGIIGRDDREQAELLAQAIVMMRETNPHNLNLPYMLEAYTSRLMMPGSAETHEQYLQAVIPPTGENKYQTAERYLLESLPIFREHYKGDNIAIYSNECKLAYAQIKQSKFAEAESHLEICRTAETRLQDESQAKVIRTYVSQIEAAAAENNR